MSIGRILCLIVIVALTTPLYTAIFDAMCWFYSSNTCTGLVYDVMRFDMLFITSVSAFLLVILLS